MARRDGFSSYHPLVNFLFFALVIAFSMFLMHPVCLAVSFFCAAAYALCLNGRKALRLQLRFLLPTLFFTAVLNPAFNHRGVTVLAHLPSGSPLTLESVLYGLAAAVMLCTVVNWFTCYTAVMTSDKFVYLFGRIIPSLSLVLSMTLRLIPRFRQQFRVVRQAQASIGRDVSAGALLQRLRNAAAILSILITWSLENAIETADSMKSRGYGLPGRTAFSIYRFDARDKAALVWLTLCGVGLALGCAAGGFAWRYFPAAEGTGLSPLSLCLQLGYLALCLTPLMLNGKEGLAWKRSHCAV